LVLVVVNLHLVQQLAPKVVVELVAEAAAVEVLLKLISLVNLMELDHQEALLQSMPRTMVAQDMMTSQ
tara:strand:+ start:247 stop:450 length:204 start_codon:yes stop_codon:yes gene_type:complete